MSSRGQHRVIFCKVANWSKKPQSQLFNMVIICKQICRAFLHQYLIMFIILSSFPFYIFFSGGICEFRLHRVKTHPFLCSHQQLDQCSSLQIKGSPDILYGLVWLNVGNGVSYQSSFIYWFNVFKWSSHACWGFVISAFNSLINSNSSFKKLFAVFVSSVQLNWQ